MSDNQEQLTWWEKLKVAVETPIDLRPVIERVLDSKDRAIEGAREIFESAKGQVSAFEALFKGAFQSIIDNVTNAFPGLVQKGLVAIDNWLVTTVKASIEGDLSAYVRDGLMSEEAKESIKGLADKSVIIAVLVSTFSMISAHTSYYGHTFRASVSESLQLVNKQYRPNLPGPGEIMRAAWTSPGDTPEIRDVMARLGYPDKWIDLMFKANYSTYTPDQAFRLWLRGVLDDQKLVQRLRENGLTDERIQELQHLYDVIPPISDILMMVGKEAFEDDQARLFGLDDETPTDAYPYAKQQGLSKSWVDRYWRAHWNHASPGQVLDMLHRGIVTEDEVYQYYRVVEIPPYWRNKLMAISYLPYNRVDTRRMHELGVISPQEVFENYLAQGYDKKRAENLTNFAVKLKAEKGRDLTVSEILKAYRTGLLDRESVLQFLVESGYSPEEADFKLTYEDYALSVKDREEHITLIGERFKAGMLDEAAARALLQNILSDEIVIDRYIAKWAVAYAKSIRRPIKSDLDKWLVYSIISVDQYVYEMQQLGYSERHIGWYLDLLLTEQGGL